MLSKVQSITLQLMELIKLWRTITHSLTPRTWWVPFGKLNSRMENNGSGKSEFRTELTAVVADLEESRLASAVNCVDKLTNQLKMENGMRFNANNLSEVIRLFLKPQDQTICQSPELKFTLQL